jgi:hypothetical protein
MTSSEERHRTFPSETEKMKQSFYEYSIDQRAGQEHPLGSGRSAAKATGISAISTVQAALLWYNLSCSWTSSDACSQSDQYPNHPSDCVSSGAAHVQQRGESVESAFVFIFWPVACDKKQEGPAHRGELQSRRSLQQGTRQPAAPGIGKWSDRRTIRKNNGVNSAIPPILTRAAQ